MDLSGIPRTWTLFVCLSWICVGQVLAEPQYVVAIPAVLEAGAETKLCASLLQPNETLVMTVTLMSYETNTTLFEKTSDTEFHTCVQFQVPVVQRQTIQKCVVEVRGDTFYSIQIMKVMIKVYQPMTFVQTDKPLYLPGQTVHFRVVTLDTKLRPVNQLYNIIEVEDVRGNRIGQWLNQSSNGKILQLSYSLNSEAREGTYKVNVGVDGLKQHHSFKVEKYVLPKFGVQINAFDEISVAQEEIKVDVCAKYTYGQPVPGTADLKICRSLINSRIILHGRRDEECQEETLQTDKNGCATFIFKMSTVPQPNFPPIFSRFFLLPEDNLVLSAKVTEDGTGISHSQGKAVKISYVIGKLSFIDTPKIYDRGSVVEGKVKVVHYNDTPIPDTVVYLFSGGTWSLHLPQSLTTDSYGVATFSFNTSTLNGDITLRARLTKTPEHTDRHPYYQEAVHTLSLIRPPSPHSITASSLELKKKDKPLRCDREETISIQYTIAGQSQSSVDVMYLILSRGAIVMQGFKKVEHSEQVSEGEVSFELKVSPDIAPVVQVVAYAILSSKTVIATSADFSTEKCFSHKASLEFSPSSAVPGEETTLQVTAQPDSLCGVSAVDQSVLIKEPGKTLNADKIFDLLPVKKAPSVPHEVEDHVQCSSWRGIGSMFSSQRQRCRHDKKDHASEIFQSLGLKMATNGFFTSCYCPLTMRYPVSRNHKMKTFSRRLHLLNSSPVAAALPAGPAPLAPPAPPIETVRTFFPETWIWDLVEVGESGTKNVSLTVPDTITTWETEAFCLSPQGFGLAPRKEITVFQPFFLELSLPYSIIRGEHFELKATIFNYLSSCIMVTVAPDASLDYTLIPLSDDQYTSCLCGGERKTLSWTMVPSALGVVNVTVRAEAVASQTLCNNEIVSVPDRGRIDVVTQSLIVKAEGTEMTNTYNWLLCPKGEALTEEVDLLLPENVIVGSARASVSVLGDILGRAMKNLDGLLKMPYGCGEQNMVLLAPNIYILQYLRNSQQLTPAIKEKATNFMTSGYQRQLNYKHSDGAYSAFGSGEGNTWLTAFVLRSFVKAQSFIYIDPSNTEQPKTWLISKQQKNGCFQKSGKLFHNRMKGGVSDEVTLSAYVTAAFLEMNMSVTNPVMRRSLSCLRESISDLNNTYTTALLAYVFTLAGDMETRAYLLKHLDTVAIQEGGFLHWSQTAAETSASLAVEISSYVLLAKLSAPPSAEDLGYATRIARWLTGQQNHYGGFSSTQDTVVALQALALYSTVVFSPEGSSTVTVQSPSGQLTFDVNQNNRLLYQEEALQDMTGKHSLEVEGTACAAVQISLHYNVPTPTDVTTFSVEVEPEADCTSERPKITLTLKFLYTGKETTTNMVILDIKMLSGFVPDQESLKKLKGALLVDRVEQSDDHVLVYIQELTKDIPINLSLELIQEVLVQNLKPAVVKIYDYYQPSDQAETEYIYPCAPVRSPSRTRKLFVGPQ
ncbi:alpha-2-macroglobulin-like isoform X2 [Epinephelus lanceolatus]